MSKRVKFGAGFYTLRHNASGKVYDYDCRKTWIPSHYQKGSKNSIGEVRKHLLWLERTFKNQDDRSGAEYFDKKDLNKSKEWYEYFTKQYPDFAKEPPPLDLIVKTGLDKWTNNRILRPHLKTKKCMVPNAIKWFLDDKNIREEELSEHTKHLPQILSLYEYDTVYELFEPFQVGDDPSKSVLNQIKKSIQKLKRNDGKNYSPNTYLKRAKLIQDFFTTTKKNYQIQYSNPVEGIVAEFSYKETRTPKTADLEKVMNLFKLLKDESKYQCLIPYACLYWFTGRRPSDFFKWVKGFGNAPLDYSHFGGFTNESVLFSTSGCRFWLPAIRKNNEGKIINGTKRSREEDGELSESGLLWMRYYFETLLKADLPKDGVVYYSRDLWSQVRAKAGWGVTKEEIDKGGPDAWVNDLGRHTYNTAMRLYKPKYLGTIASLAGHTEETFKNHYKNPRLPLKDAVYFLESIRPETI